MLSLHKKNWSKIYYVTSRFNLVLFRESKEALPNTDTHFSYYTFVPAPALF